MEQENKLRDHIMEAYNGVRGRAKGERYGEGWGEENKGKDGGGGGEWREKDMEREKGEGV